MNRRLAYLEKINPEVAQIKKKSLTNIEQGWEYIKLLLQKNDLENSVLGIWLNSKYHILEENTQLQVIDTRPFAAGLFYIGCLHNGENISKESIRQVLKPLTEITLNEKIKDLKILLNLK